MKTCAPLKVVSEKMQARLKDSDKCSLEQEKRNKRRRLGLNADDHLDPAVRAGVQAIFARNWQTMLGSTSRGGGAAGGAGPKEASTSMKTLRAAIRAKFQTGGNQAQTALFRLLKGGCASCTAPLHQCATPAACRMGPANQVFLDAIAKAVAVTDL